jgi:hypothetical protein
MAAVYWPSMILMTISTRAAKQQSRCRKHQDVTGGEIDAVLGAFQALGAIFVAIGHAEFPGVYWLIFKPGWVKIAGNNIVHAALIRTS